MSVDHRSPELDRLLAELRSPLLKQLAAYWLQRRDGARVTRRSAIDPRDFPSLLQHIFLYDYDPATRRLTLRLAGEEIRRMLPRSNPGARLDEIIPPAYFPTVEARYRRVCEEPAIMHAVGRVFLNLGGTGSGERILLPLAGDDGVVRQMLGATLYQLGDRYLGGTEFDREEVAIGFAAL